MYKKFLKTKYVIFFCFCLFFLLSSIFSCSYAMKISDGEEGFFRTGNMHYARSGHSAILLKDGRVLIVGGRGGGEGEEASWTTEIYDPKTQTFSLGPKLNFRRFFTPLLYLCEDGKVLIFPCDSAQNHQNQKEVDLARTVEVYDPKTNTISLGAKFPEDTSFPAMPGMSWKYYIIELNKNTLLLQNNEKLAFLYNPKDHTWKETDRLIDYSYYSYLKELHNDNEKLIFLASDDGVLCVDKKTLKSYVYKIPGATYYNDYKTGIEINQGKFLILAANSSWNSVEKKSYYKYKSAIFDLNNGSFSMIESDIINMGFVNEILTIKRKENDIVMVKKVYPVNHDPLFGFDTTKNEFYKKTYMTPTGAGNFIQLKDGTYLYTGGSTGAGWFSPTKKAYIFK